MEARTPHTALPPELRAVVDILTAEIHELRAEVSTLRREVRRPEQTVYRPADLPDRLKVKSRQHVYNLWNSGKLRYNQDERGRYSTEAQVQEYQRNHAGTKNRRTKPAM